MKKESLMMLSALVLLPFCVARASVSQVTLEVVCSEGEGEFVTCPEDAAQNTRVVKGLVRGLVNSSGTPERIFEVGPQGMTISFDEIDSCPTRELKITPKDASISVRVQFEGEDKPSNMHCAEGCMILMNDVVTEHGKGYIHVKVNELFH